MGGDQHDGALQERLKEQRAKMIKFRKEKMRKNTLREQKEEYDQKLLETDAPHQDLQEENAALRRITEELRLKYKSALSEIKDINHEHELEKEGILENVRDLEHECDFLLKTMEYLLPKGELRNIRKRSKFDEINNAWRVPPFVLQSKTLVFPKLQNKA